MQHVACVISLLLPGQASLPTSTAGWLQEYRDAVSSELIDGDVSRAIVVYRRVAVSRAPQTYVLRARYRLAGALAKLGRDREAQDVLQRLRSEMPPHAPLRPEVDRWLARLEAAVERPADHWREQLARALSAGNAEGIDEAAAALASIEGPDGIEALLEAYALPSSRTFRPMLLTRIAGSEWPGAVPIIRQALNDSVPAVVAVAAGAVSTIGDAESAGMLMALLSAPHDLVRQTAITSLRDLRALSATEALIAVATDDPSPAVRAAAEQALRCLGSARASRGLRDASLNANVEDCKCRFSTWYREVCHEETRWQRRFPEPTRAGWRAPCVGVVVSAMTHHGPRCNEALARSYAAQVRKAWTLQRAGFDVCLLVEPEVLEDPDGASIHELLDPPVEAYPLGRWPACDAMVIDQLAHLPTSVVRTVRAFCAAGGKAIVCGASGGGWCGDGVTWREVIGVRRLRAAQFSREAVTLSWARGTEAEGLPTSNAPPWTTRRNGSFFAHEPLGGTPLAGFDSPDVWALRLQEVGSGRVLCINWDIGLNVVGLHDEDELLCRCIDFLLGDAEPWPSSLYRLMRARRWGDLAAAKRFPDAAGLAAVPPRERIETIGQLYRIYLLENNRTVGERVCERWLQRGDVAEAGRDELTRIARAPKVVQIALAVGNSFVWWHDVPGWMIPAGGVPLWLVGARDLPARVRFRLAPPHRGPGRVRLTPAGADLTSVSDITRDGFRIEVDGTVEVKYEAAGRGSSWVEGVATMQRPTARMRITCVEERSERLRNTGDGHGQP